MSQIEITVLKQGKASRNVLTCCLFTSGDAYRSFNQYIGNFRRFLKQTEHLKTFEIRVYTDDTGKDILLEETKDIPRVTVLHFNCPQFREGKGHVGMFGALVRLLPMFEDLDLVWSSDIDIPDRWLDTNYISMLEKYECKFLLCTLVCYDEKVVWAKKHSILAGRFITKIQFPRALLTRFLNMHTEGKLNHMIEKINNQNEDKQKKGFKPSSFPYGMDEVFLNYPVYNWLKRHEIRILVETDYFIRGFAFRYNDDEAKKLTESHYWNPTHAKFLRLKEMYKKYLPKDLERHQCYKDFLDLLPTFKNNFIKYKVISGSEL